MSSPSSTVEHCCQLQLVIAGGRANQNEFTITLSSLLSPNHTATWILEKPESRTKPSSTFLETLWNLREDPNDKEDDEILIPLLHVGDKPVAVFMVSPREVRDLFSYDRLAMSVINKHFAIAFNDIVQIGWFRQEEIEFGVPEKPTCLESHSYRHCKVLTYPPNSLYSALQLMMQEQRRQFLTIVEDNMKVLRTMMMKEEKQAYYEVWNYFMKVYKEYRLHTHSFAYYLLIANVMKSIVEDQESTLVPILRFVEFVSSKV
jgi:hypothetical protein